MTSVRWRVTGGHGHCGFLPVRLVFTAIPLGFVPFGIFLQVGHVAFAFLRQGIFQLSPSPCISICAFQFLLEHLSGFVGVGRVATTSGGPFGVRFLEIVPYAGVGTRCGVAGVFSRVLYLPETKSPSRTDSFKLSGFSNSWIRDTIYVDLKKKTYC